MRAGLYNMSFPLGHRRDQRNIFLFLTF